MRFTLAYFSGKALKKNGSLNDLIQSSQRYGASLAIELRKRVYNEVIPTLANGILLHKIKIPAKDELDKIFEISLTILFRLIYSCRRQKSLPIKQIKNTKKFTAKH